MVVLILWVGIVRWVTNWPNEINLIASNSRNVSNNNNNGNINSSIIAVINYLVL